MKKLSANDIAGELRREISSGVLAVQDRLRPERELAERFNAGRGTIRRAIRQLEESGYVQTRAGSGTYVIAGQDDKVNDVIANASPLELIDARFAIEPHMCRLAVLNARQQDFEELERLLLQMERSVGDPTRFAELDTRFHAFIAETTGNKLLIWVLSQINSVRNQEQWSLMRHLTLNESMINQYNSQHRQIVNAIHSREPERAAMLMKDHLEAARLSLTRSAAT
ncbi:FCD domain-containing protein [Nitratireductor sp. XY-223]|uniref:FadR/GntR family transcriptional regulator n=1 Tax=Nitratireductor sp. XY-223 TaxID=2561926 RepID=UPI0010AB321B|nr:FCD domain-containing protein [Nitratireductor sp. XY-223]